MRASSRSIWTFGEVDRDRFKNTAVDGDISEKRRSCEGRCFRETAIVWTEIFSKTIVWTKIFSKNTFSVNGDIFKHINRVSFAVLREIKALFKTFLRNPIADRFVFPLCDVMRFDLGVSPPLAVALTKRLVFFWNFHLLFISYHMGLKRSFRLSFAKHRFMESSEIPPHASGKGFFALCEI